MVYRVTASFPATERYGLAAQMRSAVVSIGANIAEGCGKGSRADTNRFFQTSFGSACELLHHFILATDLGFLTEDQFQELESQLEPIRKMLAKLMWRVRLYQTAPKARPSTKPRATPAAENQS
jgi:four helix bundle protein